MNKSLLSAGIITALVLAAACQSHQSAVDNNAVAANSADTNRVLNCGPNDPDRNSCRQP